MKKLSTAKRLALCVALAGTMGSSLISSAHADPQQYTAFVGVGSDTVQDVMNAFAGFTNGTIYTPLQATTTNKKQLVSFDAVPPVGTSGTCITAKVGGPSFTRPNGSGAGLVALSRSLDGTPYTSPGCGGTVDISSQVDFARSSKGPAAGDTGTALTYIPFGRDAVSFAYYRASGGAAVSTLTRGDLTALFTTGPQTINGVQIIPCGIQVGSGTYNFWNTVTTANATQEASSTAQCNALLPAGRAEENDGSALKARGDVAPAGSEVIIGFSAGSFLAKSNGVATGAPPAGVGIGSISDNGSGANIGSPLLGSAPTLDENPTFYNDGVFGRDVYTVWGSSKVGTGLTSDAAAKSLVVGTGSAVCTSGATIDKFGFLPIGSRCGSTVLKGSLQ